MGRRTLNLRDLRAAAEAAEKLGLNQPAAPRRPRGEPAERKVARPEPAARMRVVWAVCDVGGRTVQTFDYADKALAEARAVELKAQKREPFFVRSLKEPM